MNKPTKIIGAIVGAAIVVASLSGCLTKSEQFEERETLQEQSRDDSLELKNLQEKVSREDDATALRYVYLINYGTIFGYYSTEGKISSSASQIAPEQEFVKVYESSTEYYIIDSTKDDGSYGPGDPGIFFFTTEGVMVETSLDYIISDAPLPIDVPRLNENP